MDRKSIGWLAAVVCSSVAIESAAMADSTPTSAASVPTATPTPTPTDCVAASRAAADLGKRQQYRAERSQLLLCAAESCPDDIRSDCARRSDEVLAKIPTLVITAKNAAGAAITAVKVTIDGEAAVDHLDGAPVPIDPGEHTFTFEAPGYPLVTQTWMVGRIQAEHRDVTFESPVGPDTARAPVAATATAPGDGTGPHRTAALVGVGVAAVGLGFGTAYGVLALTRKSSAHDICPGSTICSTQAGVNAWSRAETAANVSTVMFVVAGLGALEAAIFWLAPSSSSATAPQVGLGPGIIQVKGVW